MRLQCFPHYHQGVESTARVKLADVEGILILLQPMRKMSRSELIVQPPNSSEFPYMDILEDFMAKYQTTLVSVSMC